MTKSTSRQNRRGAVRASAQVTGDLTVDGLRQKVRQAIQEDPRWDTDQHGYPEGSPGDWEPYVLDLKVPGDDGQWCAIIQTDDGRTVCHGFSLDENGDVEMDEGDSEPTEPTTIYSREIRRQNKLRAQAVTKAAGNSDGAGKGHGTRKGTAAEEATKGAHEASMAAHESGEETDHDVAADKHAEAYDKHQEAFKAKSKAGADKEETDHHLAAMNMHKAGEEYHRHHGSEEPEDAEDATKARGVVRCRDIGIVLPVKAEKVWELDKPIDIQWMPGGISTITATYGSGTEDRPIRMTVLCDEASASSVQSRFESVRAEFPRRPPFVCVEHRAQERAGEPVSFAWKTDPEPAIYCTLKPSSLGVTNVNGRIHTSFSPTFATDAEYDKLVKGEDGIWFFPTGARGSNDNPAHVVAADDQSVGSLTNWPAFKNILPVAAREASAVKVKTSEQVLSESVQLRPEVAAIFSKLPPHKEKSAEEILARLG